jgi:hypothetical protein
LAQTAQQICELALQDAKCPGFGFQAGQNLNMILSELCQNYDLEVAQGYATFNFVQGLISNVPSFPGIVAGGGPYPLPADYLRANYGDVWFIDNSAEGANIPRRLIAFDLADFDMLIQQAGLQSYPTIYATDLSLQYADTPLMVVWPPPNGNYPVSIRYRRQMPDITSPQTSSVVPWFPNASYLRTKLAAQLMKITDDERWQAFETAADEILRRYLRLKDDHSTRSHTVKLDQRRFGPDQSALPATKITWW